VKHTRLKPPKDAKHEGGPCCRSGNQRNENREQGTPVTLVAPSFPRRNHEESRTKEETNRSPSSKESGPVEKNRSGQQCAKKHQPKSCGEQHALSIDHHWWFLNLPYSAGFHPEGILAAEDKGQSRKLPRVALVPHFRFPTATKWTFAPRIVVPGLQSCHPYGISVCCEGGTEAGNEKVEGLRIICHGQEMCHPNCG
jgi:hypothetical protein